MFPVWTQLRRHCLLLPCLALGAVPLCGAQESNDLPAEAAATPVPSTTAATQLPAVDKLMGELLARLPSQPILLSGDLVTVTTNGTKARIAVDILLSYPRAATYTIRDAFGKELEELTVLREGTSARYIYKQNGTESPTPPLGQRVQDTALTWMDLTLGFLWWEGGRIIGQMETRGQPCYVLDRHAPSGAAAPYASVRMWVDQRVSMLLQAEGYNMLGDCIRRLSVKSFKKVRNEWMVKDLAFEDLPDGPRTILRIRNAEPASPEAGLP